MIWIKLNTSSTASWQTYPHKNQRERFQQSMRSNEDLSLVIGQTMILAALRTPRRVLLVKHLSFQKLPWKRFSDGNSIAVQGIHHSQFRLRFILPIYKHLPILPRSLGHSSECHKKEALARFTLKYYRLKVTILIIAKPKSKTPTVNPNSAF